MYSTKQLFYSLHIVMENILFTDLFNVEGITHMSHFNLAYTLFYVSTIFFIVLIGV